MKTTPFAISLLSLTLGIAAPAHAQTSTSARTRPPANPLFAQPPSNVLIGQPGEYYGVDEQGGYLRFRQPPKPKLVADGFTTNYDIAIKGKTAYYISSGGYLLKSNLKDFKTTTIAYSGSFNALDFSPTGQLYAMSASATGLYQIDIRTGKARYLFDVGHTSAGDICFINRQTLLLSSSDGNLVRINLATKTSKVIKSLGAGEWYSMDYRSGKVHLIDNNTGNYYTIDYPSLKRKKVGNIFGDPSISGVNGLSFR